MNLLKRPKKIWSRSIKFGFYWLYCLEHQHQPQLSTRVNVLWPSRDSKVSRLLFGYCIASSRRLVVWLCLLTSPDFAFWLGVHCSCAAEKWLTGCSAVHHFSFCFPPASQKASPWHSQLVGKFFYPCRQQLDCQIFCLNACQPDDI